MKNEKRKYTGRNKFARTPWGFYLLMAVVAWCCVILGMVLGFAASDKADAAAPVAIQSVQVAETRPVALEAHTEPLVAEEDPLPLYSEQELEILALIIYQEAGADACSNETRQMVGEVFLNRVASSGYPDSFHEVALQKAQYGLLYWTGLEWPERAVLPQEAHAVERAYDVAVALLTGEAERLLPEDAIFQAEFPQGTETLAEQDGLYFCR